MKKETKQQRKVIDFLTEMQWMFNLQNYDRTLTFMEKESQDTVADVIVEEDYSRVYIKIYPLFWTYTLDEQRKFLLHEMTHSLVEPTRDIADNLLKGKFETQDHLTRSNEKVTSMVSNILHSLLIGNLKYSSLAYNKYLKK